MSEWSFVRLFVRLDGFNDIATYTCTNEQCIIWLLCVAVKFIACLLALQPAYWFVFLQNRNENFRSTSHIPKKSKEAYNNTQNYAAHNKKLTD